MAITINNLIGGSINIVTGGGTSERWVEPQYTDEWVFSNGGSYPITFDHMYDDQYMPNLQPNGGTPKKGLVKQSDIATLTEISWDVTSEYYGGVTELTAYRKYTPGHWEDANGNWINGNWGTWSNKSIKGWGEYYDWDDNKSDYVPSGKYAWMYNDMEPITIEKDSYSYNTDENYYTTVLYGWRFGEEYIVANRTWNNAKPAA